MHSLGLLLMKGESPSLSRSAAVFSLLVTIGGFVALGVLSHRSHHAHPFGPPESTLGAGLSSGPGRAHGTVLVIGDTPPFFGLLGNVRSRKVVAELDRLVDELHLSLPEAAHVAALASASRDQLRSASTTFEKQSILYEFERAIHDLVEGRERGSRVRDLYLDRLVTTDVQDEVRLALWRGDWVFK